MSYATPSLLADTDNWGAFVFFACWCLVSLLYVYLLVPETAGLSLEEVEDLFIGPWLQTKGRRGNRLTHAVDDDEVLEGYDGGLQCRQYVHSFMCEDALPVLTHAIQLNERKPEGRFGGTRTCKTLARILSRPEICQGSPIAVCAL